MCMKQAAFFSLFLFSFLTALARDPGDGSGSIRGTVRTADGNPVAEATVQITGTSKAALTDESGLFEFRKLPAGTYQLRISFLGFETVERSVALADGQQSQLEVALTLSSRELSAVVVTSN